VRPLTLLVALGALVVAACATAVGSPTATARPQLGISSGTTLVVTVVINGRVVGTSEPGGPSPTFDPATLPGLPWTVEARSPSGRVLTSMRVEPGDIWTTARPGGAVEQAGTLGRVDLSCGSLRIWAGDVMPSGPFPGSGTPGDCAP
jgi:hypothetical protein